MFKKLSQNCLLALFIILSFQRVLYADLQEFDTSKATVPLADFMSGGPAKDGIPALTNPRFVTASQAKFLKDDDMIAGITLNGQAKAYPIKILNWHEIANDRVGNIPIAVTWCPLTKSAVTFDRRLSGRTLEFGVSGLLYNSNVVMYDRNTNGLWSQMKTKGVSGQYADQSLTLIPTELTTWKKWRMNHPNTMVLSKSTGHLRKYSSDPYKFYHANSKVMFPIDKYDRRLPLKDLVIGIRYNQAAKAYPLKVIKKKNAPIADQIAGVDVTIEPTAGNSAVIKDKDGNVLPSVVAYWFAWSTFNQDTLLYK